MTTPTTTTPNTVKDNVARLKLLVSHMQSMAAAYKAATASVRSKKEIVLKVEANFDGVSEPVRINREFTVDLCTEAMDICVTSGKLPDAVNTAAILRIAATCQVFMIEFSRENGVLKTADTLDKATKSAAGAVLGRDALNDTYSLLTK